MLTGFRFDIKHRRYDEDSFPQKAPAHLGGERGF
jgi:hypothetical protein